MGEIMVILPTKHEEWSLVKFGFIITEGRGDSLDLPERAPCLEEGQEYPVYPIIDKNSALILKDFIRDEQYIDVLSIIYNLLDGEEEVKQLFYGVWPQVYLIEGGAYPKLTLKLNAFLIQEIHK